MGVTVGIIIAEYVGGAVAGLLLGLTSYFFKFISGIKHINVLKAVYISTIAIGCIIASELSGFINARITSCIVFGYTCS